MRAGFHALVRQPVSCPWNPGRAHVSSRMLDCLHLSMTFASCWIYLIRHYGESEIYDYIPWCVLTPSLFAQLPMCVLLAIRTIAVRALAAVRTRVLILLPIKLTVAITVSFMSHTLPARPTFPSGYCYADLPLVRTHFISIRRPFSF